MNELVKGSRGGLQLTTLGDMRQFAELVCKSGWVPRGMQPDQAIIAMQYGYEVGLTPMQALQNVSVINGRPAIWGDAALALVQASGLLEDMDEHCEADPKQGVKAVCRCKRRGQATWIEKTFSEAKAKRAGLWGKQGPWSSYPDRMLQMRARGFALRDGFADVLKGLMTVEEAQDIPVAESVVAAPAKPDNGTRQLTDAESGLYEVENVRAVKPMPEPVRTREPGEDDPASLEDALGSGVKS